MKKDELRKLSDRNNGYLFTADVLCMGISKTYLAQFVKENGYERVGHGIYAAPDIWPQGYNAVHLRKKKVKVRTLKENLYEMGKTVAESVYGNPLAVYDKERTICDAIIDRKKMDVQIFQTAIKEYMSDPDRKLQILVQYAEKLHMRDEIMKYVEVLA